MAVHEPDGPRDTASGHSATHGISRWEWFAAGVGLVLLCSALWVLLAEGLGAPGRPPVIELRVNEVTRAGPRWLVHVRATNHGDETAAALRLRGTLSREGAPPEAAEAEIDFVPGGSTRHVGLLFSADPRRGTLDLSAISYREP